MLEFISPTHVALALPPVASLTESRALIDWKKSMYAAVATSIADWIQQDYDPSARLCELDSSAQTFCVTACIGTIVGITTTTIDRSELRIPAKRVQLSTSYPTYYLAISADFDAPDLTIWGFATLAEIERFAEFDPQEACYVVPAEHLIQDMAVFGVLSQQIA